VRIRVVIMSLLLGAYAARSADVAAPAEPGADGPVVVELDAGEQSGHAEATIRIHAPREIVWHLLTSCDEAVKIVPGLKVCQVEETAADRSWQRIRQVMDYSWYVPRLTYVMTANYHEPDSIAFDRTSGDLVHLHGSWTLSSDGDFTIAHYSLSFAPGIWVPRWLVRAALKRDLPKMLRALRTHAEAAQNDNLG
jgi:hypothetical protein